MESASSSSELQRMYDVLINFTSEDIRRKFVSHLDSALCTVGFTTFLHEENAVKSMPIQQPILNTCRIAIVVFTKTYSQSAWCLHQLQQIIQWHQTYSRHVLPVYYELDPSDVRLQRGDFGKAFKATAHQTFSGQQLEHAMSMWSHALTKAANLFGWDESNYRKSFCNEILNGCGVDADKGIRVLIERRLVKVKKNNKLAMHPLLQKMGREIIREVSRKEPWMNSQLRFDDAEYVLTDNIETKDVKRLHVKLRSARRELRWFNLQDFSLEYQPCDFYLHDAIAIDLKHSLLRLVWNKPQVLSWLKVLNLSHSKFLKETPDFSELPSLEQLILKDCPRLLQVHQSIGSLNNLLLLNLKDCTSLSNLPTEIYELKSLRTLILSGCSEINLMEKDIAQMKSLITLIAENIAVKQVPFSIVSSVSIGYISLRGFEELSHNLFPSIIQSWMSPTMNPLSYIHSFCMDINNSWDDIAPSVRSLSSLRSVLLQCDTEFQLSRQVETILVEYGINITES